MDLIEQIESEVQKLIIMSFIREEEHPEWLVNIVPVEEKNGKIRVCIDFRDLNETCPKDYFALPIIEVLRENTCEYEWISFLDGFSGYKKIKMDLKDEKHMSFCTPFGVYCYTVLPFGLKNAGAAYQWAMMKIFGDL